MSENFKGNIDEELFQESLVEILELIESVEYGFLNLEKAKQDLDDEELYDVLMRDIHSIKGSLGMIGLSTYMDDIHHVESFLIKSFESKQLDLNQISIQAEYWGNIYRAISNSEFSIPKQFLFKNFKIKDPDLNKKQTIINSEVLFLGNKEILGSFFSKNNIDYRQLNCVNEVYNSSTVEQVKYIICHLPCLRVNPFLLQEIIHKFQGETRFCYIYDSKEELIDFLSEAGTLNISFKLFSKNAKDYQNALLNHIKS